MRGEREGEREEDTLSGESASNPRLRPVRHEDLSAVMAIEHALFPEDAWSEAVMRAEFAGVPESRYYLVAEVDRTVVGYAGLLAVGDEGDVQTIAVLPEQQRRGVGTALLTALLDEAARRRCARVFLEVRADNDRARTLYERFGFEAVNVRPGYYQPSNTDAVVMRLSDPGHHQGVTTGG